MEQWEGRDLFWPIPLLAFCFYSFGQASFGQILFWPNPLLANSSFGQILFWPIPFLANSSFGGGKEAKGDRCGAGRRNNEWVWGTGGNWGGGSTEWTGTRNVRGWWKRGRSGAGTGAPVQNCTRPKLHPSKFAPVQTCTRPNLHQSKLVPVQFFFLDSVEGRSEVTLNSPDNWSTRSLITPGPRDEIH